MQYGYFDNERREYVITRPDTPAPWMNYLGGGGFGGIVSQTGGGLSFDGDPSNRRVTRYRFGGLPADRPGRYLYIRDMDTGEYWSPTWQPVMKELTRYECRHGLGYTAITGAYGGVEAVLTYYVPPGAGYEVWRVQITNNSGETKRLRLFSYVEFSWNDAKYDMLCHWPLMALMADYTDGRIIVDTVAQQLTGVPMYSYISTDFPVCGWDCSQAEFIGYGRSETNPLAVETGTCANSAMHSDACVGVLCSELTLRPGQNAAGTYTVGAVREREAVGRQTAEAFDTRSQDEAFAELAANWRAYLNAFQVQTPDGDMNTMLNTWHAYQAKTTFDWSRFISVYERGVDRGFGFRDSMQDVLGIMGASPEKARERIKLLLSIQLRDGSARAVYYPATKQAVGGGRSDDHLWSVFSVCSYIRETGDTEILDEPVPYEDGGEGPVWEHLERGLRFTRAHLGRHGIPDMLGSDWNDSLAPMNRGNGGAESVFVFFQLAHAAYELTGLYTHLNRPEPLAYAEETYAYCASRLDAVWDGEWFLRAFTPEGEKYGTREDRQNRIYLNPQSWAVLSRLPDARRANTAFDRVMEYLYTEHGLITHDSASSGFDPAKKSYYLFTAGARENGGIFFHSNTWAVIALTLLGRAQDAWDCYRASLPCRRNEGADRYLTEPYVYSQTMLAPPHDRAGACVNSWLTGTASWMYVAATQYILGIRPDYDGLRIEPCIPEGWSGFTVRRLCRGVACRIEVRRAQTASLTAGGEAVSGTAIPWERFDGVKELSIIRTIV